MEVVNACKPDLWVSLPDEVPTWVAEKRNRLSVSRTLQWLDHCLSLQPVSYLFPRKLGRVLVNDAYANTGHSRLEPLLHAFQITSTNVRMEKDLEMDFLCLHAF